MLKNQLLQQALEKVQAAADDRESFDKLVKAGGKVIYSKGTFRQLSQHMRGSKDPAGDVAKGIVAVLKIMSHRARGTIPASALLQAGMVLVLDALDFIEQAGMVKVTSKVLDQATQEYLEALLPALGLTQQRMQATLTEIKAIMDDTEKMAEYQRTAGGAQ